MVKSRSNHLSCLVATSWDVGAHSDETRGLKVEAPIVCVSFGDMRVFRITPKKRKLCEKKLDVELHDGDLLIMGGPLQKTHKHQILKGKTGNDGNRISLTFRDFVD